MAQGTPQPPKRRPPTPNNWREGKTINDFAVGQDDLGAVNSTPAPVLALQSMAMPAFTAFSFQPGPRYGDDAELLEFSMDDDATDWLLDSARAEADGLCAEIQKLVLHQQVSEADQAGRDSRLEAQQIFLIVEEEDLTLAFRGGPAPRRART